MDDAMDCLMSFSDFLFAFQIQFYYSGESLPGPSGSCRDLTPRPALGPAVCVSGPHVSASPPCVAGFPAGRPAGCPVVAGGHTTRSASSWLRKPRRFPPAGGHISLSDNRGHTTTNTRSGMVPEAFPVERKRTVCRAQR